MSVRSVGPEGQAIGSEEHSQGSTRRSHPPTRGFTTASSLRASVMSTSAGHPPIEASPPAGYLPRRKGCERGGLRSGSLDGAELRLGLTVFPSSGNPGSGHGVAPGTEPEIGGDCVAVNETGAGPGMGGAVVSGGMGGGEAPAATEGLNEVGATMNGTGEGVAATEGVAGAAGAGIRGARRSSCLATMPSISARSRTSSGSVLDPTLE
jgi:hypothetical protein